MGSYYVQTMHLSLNSFLVAVCIGLMAAAVLMVNNYRDLDTDRKAGKYTLTHYLGRERAKILYLVLMLVPFLLPFFINGRFSEAWLLLLALPFSLVLVYRFFTQSPGPAFNTMLAQTAQLQLFYSILISVGLTL